MRVAVFQITIIVGFILPALDANLSFTAFGSGIRTPPPSLLNAALVVERAPFVHDDTVSTVGTFVRVSIRAACACVRRSQPHSGEGRMSF